MDVGELDVGIELVQLGVVDGAVFVNPVMDERATFCGGGNWYKVWQVVDVDAREWVGFELVLEGD